jgi:uncharacterized protein (DUF433 family)
MQSTAAFLLQWISIKPKNRKDKIIMETIYNGKAVEKTEHPHIVRIRGVGGGEPVIMGTRIMVRTIVEQYQLGSSIEEILWDFPQLTSAQIHDALSYYHDNKKEMDILLDQASYEYWQPIIERMGHGYTHQNIPQ